MVTGSSGLRTVAPQETAFLSAMLGRAGYIQAVQHNAVYGYREGVAADRVLAQSLRLPRMRPQFAFEVDYTPQGLFLRTLRRVAAQSFENVKLADAQRAGASAPSPVVAHVRSQINQLREQRS